MGNNQVKTNNKAQSQITFKRDSKPHSFSQLLPYETYDEETQLFTNKKSVGFVLEGRPMTGIDPDRLPQITSIFQHLMPLGSNLQCLLVASPRIENWTQPWEAERRDKSEALQKLARRRVEYLHQIASKEGLRAFRLIISYSLPRSQTSGQSVDEILTFREQLSSIFQGFEMPIWRWTATDLLRSLDELLNPAALTDEPIVDWNPEVSLARQVMRPHSRFQEESDQLVFGEGDQVLKMYTAKELPSHWSQENMSLLIGDPFDDFMRLNTPFFISYSVHVCDEAGMTGQIMRKFHHVKRQANSPMAQYFPGIHKEMDDWNIVKARVDEGQRVVRTRYQVGLYGSMSQISKEEQTLLNIYRTNRWELEPDSYLQVPSLLSALPMTWGEGAEKDSRFFQKTKTTLTHEPSNLIPLQGEWQGTGGKPGMLLTGRLGQLLYWNPFSNTGGNFNTCVVGKSGSGKSFFMQELMTTILGIGGRVFVLDVGQSFKKSAMVQGGSYLQFSVDSDICINPFSVIPLNDEKEKSEALGVLKPIISLMASPKKGTDDDEDAAIERAINIVLAQKGNTATMTDLVNVFLSLPGEKFQRLGERLYPYTYEGSSGRFFNAPANIDLKDRLVVVELEELKQRKDLQAVVVQMVILQITNEVYMGDRSTPTIVVLDEAWDLLREKQSEKFIEEAARRLRKYGGGLVVGTQSVLDFYAAPGAQAAFDNSDWICLLAQREESINQLKMTQKLGMDAYTERMLRSLRTGSDYSEVFIKSPNGNGAVCRLMVDPFSSSLYSTQAKDFSRVEEMVKQGMSMKDAVAQLAKETYTDGK